MSSIIYIASLLLVLFTLPVQAQETFNLQGSEQSDDALKRFRLLLSEQLHPERATIERVFNPIGEGQALLVRTYASGPQELVYRPLFEETEDGRIVAASQDHFVMRTLPGTELREVLINYRPEQQTYELFFGQFRYSVSPDMSDVSYISARAEAAPFLTKNFQTLFIDQPAAALGIRYLFDQQQIHEQQAMIQLKKEYKDSITGSLMITSDGRILNRHRFNFYEAINIEPVYFIEEYTFRHNERIRYYIQPNGLQSYYLTEDGKPTPGDWIPRQLLQQPRVFQPQN